MARKYPEYPTYPTRQTGNDRLWVELLHEQCLGLAEQLPREDRHGRRAIADLHRIDGQSALAEANQAGPTEARHTMTTRHECERERRGKRQAG